MADTADVPGAGGVSASGFYEWLGRSPSQRSEENARLTRRIRESFEQSDRTYGSPRVARLMRQASLTARSRRRCSPTDSGIRPLHPIAANLLDRQFEATAPNQKWVADFTYLWTTEGWLFVAAVIDLYSRRVVGWSMSASMTTQLVVDALMMAVWRRGKPVSLVHHPDQGSQYTSEDFQRHLAEPGITCSMSRRGDCWDNAAMESFFSSLKMARCHRRQYRNRDEARSDVFDYIERFYNPQRCHSTLGYLSPVEFEERSMR